MELVEIFKADDQRKIYALVLRLGIPAIIAQLASVAMQYIDAAMVGSLGASASAAVGVVTSSTWIVSGLAYAVATGFSVQIAHATGANDAVRAKKVFRGGLSICFAIACLLSFIGISLSPHLPSLMGAEPKIRHDASMYFFIYSCAIPPCCCEFFRGMFCNVREIQKFRASLKFTFVFIRCFIQLLFNFSGTQNYNRGFFDLHTGCEFRGCRSSSRNGFF